MVCLVCCEKALKLKISWKTIHLKLVEFCRGCWVAVNFIENSYEQVNRDRFTFRHAWRSLKYRRRLWFAYCCLIHLRKSSIYHQNWVLSPELEITHICLPADCSKQSFTFKNLMVTIILLATSLLMTHEGLLVRGAWEYRLKQPY